MGNKFLALVVYLISLNCLANDTNDVDLLQKEFEHDINEQHSISVFAQNVKNIIATRDIESLKKIVSYEGCSNKDDCLSETLDSICSSDKKYISDNGSICILFQHKHIETIVFAIGVSERNERRYLITYYDRDFINLQNKNLDNKQLSLALKNHKAVAEISVTKTAEGKFKIPYYIVESESYWQPE